ncbi:MAG: hypothetical protein R3222_10360 [Balneolaceae bacterium]|nr:hypothetical protein [Balneolaceae bacterium]
MKITYNSIQEDTTAAVDTLTRQYSQKWDAADGLEESGAFIQAMASNDLIFVVLTVSLIIWFVLLYYIIRVDKKVGKLEKQIEETNGSEHS